MAKTRKREKELPSKVELAGATWLRPEEASVYTGIGLTRVYHLVKTGVIPSARVPSDRSGSGQEEAKPTSSSW